MVIRKYYKLIIRLVDDEVLVVYGYALASVSVDTPLPDPESLLDATLHRILKKDGVQRGHKLYLPSGFSSGEIFEISKKDYLNSFAE